MSCQKLKITHWGAYDAPLTPSNFFNWLGGHPRHTPAIDSIDFSNASRYLLPLYQKHKVGAYVGNYEWTLDWTLDRH